MTEIQKSGQFSRHNFFIRRALRIFPLYYLIIVFSFWVLPFLANCFNQSIQLPEQQHLYWFFLSNYDVSDSIFALKFLWSIGVEEQFYLLFLFLSFFFKKYFWVPILLLSIAYLVFMFFAPHYQWDTYHHLVPHFINFAMGMFGAYLYFHQKHQFSSVLGFLVLSILCMCLLPLPLVWFNVLLSIAFVLLILCVTSLQKTLVKIKVLKLSEHLGKYTYGLYVYSGFVLTLGHLYFGQQQSLWMICLEFVLLVGIAIVSFHLFEQQFLKLKKYFR